MGQSGVSRRTFARAMAWSMPVVSVSAYAPRAAASARVSSLMLTPTATETSLTISVTAEGSGFGGLVLCHWYSSYNLLDQQDGVVPLTGSETRVEGTVTIGLTPTFMTEFFELTVSALGVTKQTYVAHPGPY